jgi:hypothetical protein
MFVVKVSLVCFITEKADFSKISIFAHFFTNVLLMNKMNGITMI